MTLLKAAHRRGFLLSALPADCKVSESLQPDFWSLGMRTTGQNPPLGVAIQF
ncbi:hypothetical protein [Methylomonas fluvii]|nr:hypothetical protein [Methylomonas fluvii]